MIGIPFVVALCEKSVILCEEGGMPVTGSSLDLSCAIDQPRLIRLSEDEFSESTRRGKSRAVVKLIMAGSIFLSSLYL